MAYTGSVSWGVFPGEPENGVGSGDESSDFIFVCPTNLECVLAVGDAEDIPALREWAAALPRKTYGRVVVEVESPVQIEPFERGLLPAGVGVTWAIRTKNADRPGATAIRAADGWLDEWLRGDPMSGRYVQLWPGLSDNTWASGELRRIADELAETFAAATEFRGGLGA